MSVLTALQELAIALKSGTRVFGRKASKGLADRLFDQVRALRPVVCACAAVHYR